MRQCALLIVSLCVLAAVGCQKKSQETAVHQEEPYTPTYSSLDSMESSPDQSYTDEPAPIETASDTQSTYQEPDETLTPVGTRVHKVSKGDTLYSLARRYYNDQGRWRDIWDANRDSISDPDKLYLGTELIIP